MLITGRLPTAGAARPMGASQELASRPTMAARASQCPRIREIGAIFSFSPPPEQGAIPSPARHDTLTHQTMPLPQGMATDVLGLSRYYIIHRAATSCGPRPALKSP